jgi:hypothetical protein
MRGTDTASSSIDADGGDGFTLIDDVHQLQRSPHSGTTSIRVEMHSIRMCGILEEEGDALDRRRRSMVSLLIASQVRSNNEQGTAG